MPDFIIIYGAPESGKTINSKALQEHYRCDHVTDGEDINWLGHIRAGDEPRRVLILTHTPGLMGTRKQPELFKNASRLQVSLAAKDLGDKWITPDRDYWKKKHAVKSQPSLPLVQGPITIDPNDPEVLDILSKTCLTCGPMAHVFQKAGYPIPTRAEYEQGHILLWMLGMYRDHGSAWRDEATAKLREMIAAAA